MYKATFSEEENGYIIECHECGLRELLTEDEFCDMLDAGLIEDDEDDEELCQCDYCCGVRDGVELAMDVMEEIEVLLEELEECECGCGECCEVCEPECFCGEDDDEAVLNKMMEEDIYGEILALKADMKSLRQNGHYDEYLTVVNAYKVLVDLITEEILMVEEI